MFHLDNNPKEELNIFSNLDWNIDYAPYEVVYEESEGRYLKATRDIKEGKTKKLKIIKKVVSGKN